MNILCVIPARSGSRGLKDKHIKPLFGKPLIVYTIEAAFESRLTNKIVVSTDGPEIAKIATKYKVQVIKRPLEYSTDGAPIDLALRHAVDYLKDKEGYWADIVVWLQANVPLRKDGQIDNVIKKLIDTNADSAVTVYQVSQLPAWMKKMDKAGFLSPFISNSKKFRRQDFEPLYLLDGAVVVIKTRVLMGTKGLQGQHVYLGKKFIGIIQERKYTIEIDNKDDFDLVKFYMQNAKEDDSI